MSLRPNARMKVIHSKYKVEVDTEEGRWRREDNMVEIQKNRREENLLKKCREGFQAQQFQATLNVPQQVDKKVKTRL
ncbi:importin subunit alpha-like [Olea europaea subsp. europaea]|uniref:Importin subunit alpha-like n=1 Tax=Olea europaea subsp. europaea TaxID=158383 RepID=A0A8S0QJH4_OLEEU|nr:importin subunit alpha-like [Olea europaea subsp. europaea]